MARRMVADGQARTGGGGFAGAAPRYTFREPAKTGKGGNMQRAGNHRSRLARAAVLTALALAVAGCGSDDDGDEDGDGAAAEPSRLAIELSGSAKKPTFSVPASVEGGVVEITFTNSAKGDHSAQLVRAEAGHTPKEALAAGGAWGERGKALPDWVVLAGGLGSVTSGASSSVTQELAPGRYIVADLDTNASAEFEVRSDGGGAEPARDGGTIEATEYAFESSGLKVGKERVLFANAGEEPHFVAGIGLKPGATVADARRFFTTEKGEPPLDESRSFSTAVIEGGDSQSVEVDLDAGSYALVCFVPDRAGGKPHALKGMISEATVGG
jgi:hypothetical protein